MYASFLASCRRARYTAVAAAAITLQTVHCDDDIIIKEERSRNPKNTAAIAATKKYSAIIVGGGTAGTTAAYVLSKWIDDNKINASVLLIDRGVDFSSEEGPDTAISSWYDNWCHYGESHESMYERDGQPYPVTPSDHRGLGGCSTHDTRITFQVRDEQNDRMAASMGWSSIMLRTYYQAALDMMPLAPALSGAEDSSLDFYDAVISTLTRQGRQTGDGDSKVLHEAVRLVDKTNTIGQPTDKILNNDSTNSTCLNRVELDEYKSEIIPNSIAQSSLAMYSDHEPAIRWSPAFLTHRDIKPKSLDVITCATVDKILFEESSAGNSLVLARGVRVIVNNHPVDLLIDRLGSGLGSGLGEVALTGGSIGNTAILHRSGLGPSKLLESLGIPIIVANDEIGHGVDHEEIAVMYEWNEKFNTISGKLPKGGVMGWPLVMFSKFIPENDNLFGAEYSNHRKSHSQFFEAHLGAGYAEPYTSFPSFVVTPSCIRPSMGPEGGFRVQIKNKDPFSSCIVLQGDHSHDIETMAQGVLSVTKLMRPLIDANIIGRQLQPPFEIKAENKHDLLEWIKSNHFTVYHWACTCQSGINGRVADEQFRVRRNKNEVIHNLRVGSAASLPELSEANPHLTVAAFAVALADAMALSLSQRLSSIYKEPVEVSAARSSLIERRDRGISGRPMIRRAGQESPDIKELAGRHFKELHSLRERDN